MRRQLLTGIQWVSLINFLYIVISGAFSAITYLPTEADSLHYHIPLAEQFIQGNFDIEGYAQNIHMYFPAATEAILAILIELKIPIGLFNVFGIVVLFLVCFRLARVMHLPQTDSLTFAATVASLYGVVRWIHAQTVDIWLAVYYLSVLALLLKPKTTWSYFLNVGILFGLLIGTKYSGPLFSIGLLMLVGAHHWQLYRKRGHADLSAFFRSDTMSKIIKLLVLLVCVGFIGGFWYVRNWLVVRNPVYPLDTALFQGVSGNEIIETPIWKAYLLYPRQMIDGAISEFIIWPVVTCVVLIYLAYSQFAATLQKTSLTSQNWQYQAGLDQTTGEHTRLLLLLAAWNFGVFLLLPSGDSMQLHVSQYRFAYVVIIPVILAFFILARKVKVFAEYLPFAVALNLIVSLPLSYRPKAWIIAVTTVFLGLYMRRNFRLLLSYTRTHVLKKI